MVNRVEQLNVVFKESVMDIGNSTTPSLPKTSTNRPVTSPPANCQAGYSYFSKTGMCYQMQLANFTDDEYDSFVAYHNGSIHSFEEDSFVRDLAINYLRALGCFSDWNYYSYWISDLISDGNGNCIWKNGQPFDYSNQVSEPYDCTYNDADISIDTITNKTTLNNVWGYPSDADWFHIPDKCKSILSKRAPL
ncbi:hypothetical protein WR25_13007 [Diploscapter pachys]|uniref:C-type lectin domain-containing protein n=1 Tax=Diploscapter pachys TaxID=2018661 RepID=A0A2A2L127_9BILA|nr:hypothetical protein WR25_13007 [Diploscapter pachys]